MKISLVCMIALSMIAVLFCARDAFAVTGFPSGFSFGRLEIVDGGQMVDLHHPTDRNASVQHLRLGLRGSSIVDARWERIGNMARIIVTVVEANGSSREMLLAEAYVE